MTDCDRFPFEEVASSLRGAPGGGRGGGGEGGRGGEGVVFEIGGGCAVCGGSLVFFFFSHFCFGFSEYVFYCAFELECFPISFL